MSRSQSPLSYPTTQSRDFWWQPRSTLPGAWPSNLSSRSVFFVQPIGAPGTTGKEAIQCLLDEHDRVLSQQVVFAEIRPMCIGDTLGDSYEAAGYEKIDYNNYELNLKQEPDEIFRRMNPKRRNNIRANQRRGLTVREACPQKDLADFYGHLRQSHRRSRVPLVDIGFFEELFDQTTRRSVSPHGCTIQWQTDRVGVSLLFEWTCLLGSRWHPSNPRNCRSSFAGLGNDSVVNPARFPYLRFRGRRLE